MTMLGLPNSLAQQVERLVLLVYYRQSLSGDWGHMGENAQQVSLCYALMGLSSEIPISDSIVSAYFAKIDELLRYHHILGLPLETIDNELSEFKFVWDQQSYSIEELDELTEALQASGCDVLIQGGYYGKTLEMICGRGQLANFGDLKVTTIEEEYYRTPTVLLPIAAMISFQHIFVRKVALKSIFYQKWVSFLGQTTAQLDFHDLGHRIGSLIRQGANRAYQSNLMGQEALFVEDMYTNVLYHELGHAVIQHHFLDIDCATVGEGVKMLGEQVVIDLLELLAEIAPVHGELMGPLQRMIGVAKQDQAAAERMFWTYFSDAWFFDTPDVYMFGYSTYFTCAILNSVRGDSIDFELMSLNLSKLLPFVKTHLEKMTGFLLSQINGATYVVDDHSYSKDEFLELTSNKSKPPEKYLETPYLKLSWEYSKCLENLNDQPVIRDGIMTRLQEFRYHFDQELVALIFEDTLGNQELQGYILPFVMKRLS